MFQMKPLFMNRFCVHFVSLVLVFINGLICRQISEENQWLNKRKISEDNRQ